MEFNDSRILNKSLFDEHCLSLRSIQRIEKVAERKEIDISVFGQHNCGKSTLANALLGEEWVNAGMQVVILTILQGLHPNHFHNKIITSHWSTITKVHFNQIVQVLQSWRLSWYFLPQKLVHCQKVAFLTLCLNEIQE